MSMVIKLFILGCLGGLAFSGLIWIIGFMFSLAVYSIKDIV